MNKKKILIVVVTVLLALVIIGVDFIVRRWHQPMGEAISLPTRTPISNTNGALSVTNQPNPSNQEVQDKETAQPAQEPGEEEPAQPNPTATAEALPTEEPLCGGPLLMYILGVGVDTRDPKYLYGLADVIRIVRVDFVKPKVTVLTLPRDLWVALPEIREKYAETVTHGKLNQAYLYGGPGMGYYTGPGGGPGLLARTIAYNYDLYVDHYGAVNMAAFERIVDALGGIDIYLDQDWDGRPVDENTVDLGYFTAGQHHMTGSEALRFARIRKKYSEVTRTDNQTLVICAVKDKALNPSVMTKIPQLINALIGSIQTDLSPAQIQQLACLLPKLDSEDLQFIRFPDEMMVQGRVFDPNLNNTTFVWDIPVEDIQQFVRDFENDAIPKDSDGGMQCP